MKKTNKLAEKLISAILCLSIVAGSTCLLAPCTHAQTIEGLKSEQSEIKEKIKENENEIKELEAQKADQSKIVNALNAQIDELNAQLGNIHAQQAVINEDISAAESKITKINNEIADLDKQIAKKDEEIEKTVELFCQRMKANYMAGGTTVLEMLAASSSLPNFFNRIEMFKRVTANDQKLVDDLNREIASIKKMQEDMREKQNVLKAERGILENKKGELNVAESQLDSTQAEIIAKSDEVNKKLASLNYQTKKLEVSIDQYNSEMDSIDREIEAYLRKKAEQEAAAKKKAENAGSSTPSVPSNSGSASSNVSLSGWAWPVPYSSSYISSPYGYRNDPISGVYKYHSGIDITMSGAYGKKLVATKGGTIDTVVYSDSGYGNYIIIDHGDGWASLYGHCSSIAVYEQQKVKQGDVVAYIGESGYATGPHVHFEIRYWGDKVNPSDYVSK